MPPKGARLSHRTFSEAFRRGRRVHGRLLQIVHFPAPKDGARVAVVVSKKVAKGAVARNRIRRRVYHIAKELIAGASYTGSFVFLIKQGGNDASYEAFTQDVASCLAALFGGVRHSR